MRLRPRNSQTQVIQAFDDQRRLKLIRTEAVRAGFKAAYEAQDFASIVEIARRLPETVLADDENLYMYVDVARTQLRS